MQISKNKTAAIVIAIFLTFSMGASLILIPTASAHNPGWQIPTYAYISVSPNPIGVGQTVTIYMWLNWLYDTSSNLSNNYRFHNYMLTITPPTGAPTTITFTTVQDPTSNQYTTFTPPVTGTYTLNFTFPGQLVTTTNDNPSSSIVNDTYEPSFAITTLTVQQAQIPAATGTSPLPTAFWMRPIYAENNIWFLVTSNWLGDGSPGNMGEGTSANMGLNAETCYQPDAVGPVTPHIMWTLPIESGGVAGGNALPIQGDTYFEGSAYQQRYTNPIIIDGFLVFTLPVGGASPSGGATECVNLETGKLLWSQTISGGFSFGYIQDVQDPNQHGVWPPMIMTSGWHAYDLWTGTSLFTISSVPSGYKQIGPIGEQLIYVIGSTGSGAAKYYWMYEWNSSKLWQSQYDGASTTPGNSPPITSGSTASLQDWNYNITITPLSTQSVTLVQAYYGDVAYGYYGTLPGVGSYSFFGANSQTPYTYFAVNLNASRGAIGTVMWQHTLNPPAGNITVLEAGGDPVTNVFMETYRETLNFVGYSLLTGQQLWGPTAPQQSFDYYGSQASGSLADQPANGYLYSVAFGGTLYAYNDLTGNIVWTYGNGGEGNSTFSGFNAPYGQYPTFIDAVGGGVIYMVTSEHTVETPIYKGAVTSAVNATTGQEIYKLSAYTGQFDIRKLCHRRRLRNILQRLRLPNLRHRQRTQRNNSYST